MKTKVLCGVLLMLIIQVAQAATGVYNVRDYGAKGDGKTLDHVAINKAIEAANADGGGQVVLSAGTYLCGSIRMKSNVDLHLTAGARIQAAPASMKAYDESEVFGAPEYQDGGHTYFHNSLIWAEGQQNVSITGCRNRGPKERTDVSSARDISINNVIADDCDSLAGIIITGMEGEPIRNVSLSDIRIQYRGGGKKVTKPYREQGTNYPEPRWAGPTPAYGLFARHVDGLQLRNVTFDLMRPDERPDIILEDVKNYDSK